MSSKFELHSLFSFRFSLGARPAVHPHVITIIINCINKKKNLLATPPCTQDNLNTTANIPAGSPINY